MAIDPPDPGQEVWAPQLNAALAVLDAQTVVSGAVQGDNLILSRNNGTTVNAGNVRGPQGNSGSSDSAVAGYVNNAGSATATAITSKVNLAKTELKATSLTNRLGGGTADAKFGGLRNAILNPTSVDYRICVLGSSTANGAYTTEPEKAVFQRLAYRSGAAGYLSLDAVTAPVTGTGLRWWTGAQGNTVAANYFPTARRTALANVGPDMVIHMIGENDYFYNTSIANFDANLEAALQYVESVAPGVIQVIVQAHGRYDITTTPAAQWSQYGTAMQAVAARNPTYRYYIDTLHYFYPLGTLDGNRAGIILGGEDRVHPGDGGHKYLAKIIGAHLGIPDEDDFATPQTWKFPLPGAASQYTVAGSAVAELYLTAVNYPREIEIIGSIWNSSTSAESYLQTELRNIDTTAAVEVHSIKAPMAANSVSVSSTFYVPPRLKPHIRISAWPAGGTMTVQAPPLSRAKIMVNPI